MSDNGLSYREAGVDIDVADAAKGRMAALLRTSNPLVLNSLGAFASLIDGRFADYRHPVLVFKTEEPGSKQKLAADHGRLDRIGFDLVNHLVNDIIVLGARPIAVQDCIVCGKLDPAAVTRIVGSIARACEAQGCSLVGGETSEQPGIIPGGTYVLSASVIGVVEKELVVDGSAIAAGDQVLALPSNGLHTNGYSLVRALLGRRPELARMDVSGRSFLEWLFLPHTCYWGALRHLSLRDGVHGMAHITGGGIADNLRRILRPGLGARIDLAAVRVLPIFRAIRDEAAAAEADMLRTFNLGVGMTLVAAADRAARILETLRAHGHDAYPIGGITAAVEGVVFDGALRWGA